MPRYRCEEEPSKSMREVGSVLFVDDDPDWVELLRMAFQRIEIPNPIHGVGDGPEAIRYLRGEGRYAKRADYPLPELVLVDLRLPGMPGFEVLQWIRQQPGLARLAVVVITGMAAPGDAQRAQELGATACLAKPFSFDKQVELARQIRDRWLQPGRQFAKG